MAFSHQRGALNDLSFICIQVELGCNLRVRWIQVHQVKAWYPAPQRLMVPLKDRSGDVVESIRRHRSGCRFDEQSLRTFCAMGIHSGDGAQSIYAHVREKSRTIAQQRVVPPTRSPS